MLIRISIRTLGIFVAATALLAGCRDSGLTQPVDPAIEVAETSIFLTTGESRTLPVNVAPANTPWTAESDDTSVATVTQAGGSVTITAGNVGFATVYLTLTQYPGVGTQIAVEVTTP